MERLADRWAAGLSTLCVLHCLAGGFAVALIAPLEPLLGHGVHVVGLLFALPLASYALVRGYLGHGRALPGAIGAVGLMLMIAGLAVGHDGGREFALTAVGAAILAGAHLINMRYCQPARG